MSILYIVALYCLVPDQPNYWTRNQPAKVEAPACMEHREEYAGTLQECSTRGVIAHRIRLAKLHDKPFVFSGIYCREIKQ